MKIVIPSRAIRNWFNVKINLDIPPVKKGGGPSEAAGCESGMTRAMNGADQLKCGTFRMKGRREKGEEEEISSSMVQCSLTMLGIGTALLV